MSLPPAQQRVLDGMAEAMQASEPRLVSMFAMFTRLTRNEAAPGREQLARRPLRDFLSLLAFWRPVGASGRRSSARWRRVRLIAQLAIGVALFGLLTGMSSGSSAGYPMSSHRAQATARVAHGSGCPVQAGAVPAQPGGK